MWAPGLFYMFEGDRKDSFNGARPTSPSCPSSLLKSSSVPVLPTDCGPSAEQKRRGRALIPPFSTRWSLPRLLNQPDELFWKFSLTSEARNNSLVDLCPLFKTT